MDPKKQHLRVSANTLTEYLDAAVSELLYAYHPASSDIELHLR